MNRRLATSERANAGLEFALIAPVLLSLVWGSIGLGVAIWTLTVLQGACEQAARCSAIGSSACAAVTAGCDSTSPVVCYTELMATDMGVVGVTKGEVTVATTTSGGVSFVSVAVAHTFSFNMFGYQLTINAKSMFPLNVSSPGTSPPSS